MRHARRAMTLVEVLSVVVILGLMAGTLTVGFARAFGKGKRELARTGIGIIASHLELYHMEHAEWPAMDIGLGALSDGHAPPTAAYYIGIDKLLDPWGHPYQLRVPGRDGHPYEVISLGADHAISGSGEDADLSSLNLRAPQ